MGRAAWSVLLSAVVAQACQAPHPAVVAAVDRVDEARLMAHVEALCALGPRPGGDEKVTEQTLRYLERELRSCGYAPERRKFFAWTRVYERTEGGFSLTGERRFNHNLVVEKRGAARPEAVVELGAHYDTVPWSPGADDNTSGVAAALEVARAIADTPTEKTIRIVFFALEEEGKVGSREYVKQLVASGDEPEGMLSLDSIGFTNDAPGSQYSPVRIPLVFSPPTEGDFVLVAGNWSSGWLGNLLEGCIATYVPELRYYSLNRIAGWFDDSSRGDHYNYWQAGIPSIVLSDVPYHRGPHYHKSSDTPATLDPTFLWRNTKAVTATMLEWAGVRGVE